jgi:hypothetical protein
MSSTFADEFGEKDWFLLCATKMEDALGDTIVAEVVELSELPGEVRNIPVNVDSEARKGVYMRPFSGVSQRFNDNRKLDDATK